jgi:hypothetical protein
VPSRPSILNRAAWGLTDLDWHEDDMLIAVAETLFKLTGFTFAHDMNAGKRSALAGGRAKLMGMRAGEPDLRFYLPRGKLGLIEYKRTGGRLSPAQKVRHEMLSKYGHHVHIIRASCPNDAIEQTKIILRSWRIKC